MRFGDLVLENKKQPEQLNEVAFLPIVYAVAAMAVTGLAVDFAVEKTVQILENGRRKRWQFASDELPEGTKIQGSDGTNYTYRKSANGYSWFVDRGNRFDALPDNRATTDTISNAWQHSFDNKKVDFSDVKQADFDRAYSVSQMRRLPENTGKNYQELVSQYERETSENRRAARSAQAYLKRWANRAGIALTLVQAFALYELWQQTQTQIKIMQYKRDNNQIGWYTAEDYDKDITGLRTMVIPIMTAMIAQIGVEVFMTLLIRVFDKNRSKPQWWRRIPVISKVVKYGGKGLQLGTIGIAMLPSVREDLADIIFQSWLVDEADAFVGRQLARAGVDWEKLFTDLNMAETNTQVASDAGEESVPVDDSGAEVTTDEVGDAMLDFWNN